MLKLFFQIVGSYLELMNMNHAWLSKSVEKYHLWLWYHLKNIECHSWLVINSIFFLMIIITTCDIFQYSMHDSYIQTRYSYSNLGKQFCEISFDEIHLEMIMPDLTNYCPHFSFLRVYIILMQF